MKIVRFIKDYATKKAGELGNYDSQLAHSLIRKEVAELVEQESNGGDDSAAREVLELRDTNKVLSDEVEVLLRGVEAAEGVAESYVELLEVVAAKDVEIVRLTALLAEKDKEPVIEVKVAEKAPEAKPEPKKAAPRRKPVAKK